MIKLEEVEHIAKLARIKFSKKELKQLQVELSSILDYIDKLKEVDIKGIEPSSIALVENVMRKDVAKKTDMDIGAPSTEKGFVKIKPIFE